MRSLLRSLRLLILGETWVIPVGVAAVLVTGFGMRALDAELWRDAGGAALLAGVLGVLWTATSGPRRGRRRP